MTEIDRRKFLTVTLLSGLSLALNGCAGLTDQMTLDEILAWLRNNSAKDSADSDEETQGAVKLALTYPAGKSPKVFTSGWVFGARCIANGEDISDKVEWSGNGVFNPNTGPRSRPVFNNEGMNQITLTVNFGGKLYVKSFNVTAVSPAGYAAVGGKAQAPADAHGCPACPHPCIGPIQTGSPNVFVNGKPAARVGDRGIHAICCGPNSYEIVGGDSEVLINGRAAAKIGSMTRHCGGTGQIVSSG